VYTINLSSNQNHSTCKDDYIKFLWKVDKQINRNYSNQNNSQLTQKTRLLLLKFLFFCLLFFLFKTKILTNNPNKKHFLTKTVKGKITNGHPISKRISTTSICSMQSYNARTVITLSSYRPSLNRQQIYIYIYISCQSVSTRIVYQQKLQIDFGSFFPQTGYPEG